MSGMVFASLACRWIWAFCFATGCLLAARPLIHWFQLESYQFPGYFRTLRRKKGQAWLPGIRMAAACLGADLLVLGLHSLAARQLWASREALGEALAFAALCLIHLALGLLFYRSAIHRKEKKKLVYTPRVKRLYAVCAVVWTLLYFGWTALLSSALSQEPFSLVRTGAALAAWYAFAVLLPLWLALGGLLAWPIEKGISEMYFRDAQRILRERKDLIRIGITGSWGKTSVKFILGTLLSEKYPTLVTPASYNTPMGVTRVIRTRLEPGCRVFVAEMGARHVGDIREMCRLVHPQIGILTSVGPQHLDTFHTQENVTRTKYELIDAIPQDGKCFFADDDGIVTGLWEKTGKERYLAGTHPERDDCWVEDVQVSPAGSRFLLCTRDGERVVCETELLGELNIRNIALCASVCFQMGLSGREITRGIRKLHPVEHRLELKRNPGGLTVLDDAFNSNIRGAKQAFETLKEFPGKRIVVTPGMVELGAQEAEMNREFGRSMAGSCDEAILVGLRRSEAISEGLRQEHFPAEHIHPVHNLQEAAAMLQRMAGSGDTVLFENDLPDNYSEE